MNWNNLAVNKCPQCNKDFMKGLGRIGMLMTHPCGFKINELKYTEIVNNIISKKPVKHYRPFDEEPE